MLTDKECACSTNTIQLHFLDLPFPKKETAMGTVEARRWGIVDIGDLRPWGTLKTKENLGNEKACSVTSKTLAVLAYLH